jgi:hypothetical protein
MNEALIIQAGITTFSLASIGLGYWPYRDLRRWGALCGLAAQPFWLWLVISKGIWGILPLTPVYTGMYAFALYGHWRRYLKEKGQ